MIDYVSELVRVMNEEKFHIPGKDLTDPAVAKAIYTSHMLLKDPVENALGRIGGLIFIKSDYVSCMEKRVSLKDGWPGVPVEMTQDEKNKVRSYKEDIIVLEVSRAAIEQLRGEAKTIKDK